MSCSHDTSYCQDWLPYLIPPRWSLGTLLLVTTKSATVWHSAFVRLGAIMVSARKAMTRRVKAARRTLNKIAAQPTPRCSTRPLQQRSIEVTEQSKQDARIARFEETRKRNVAAQLLPPAKKRRKAHAQTGTSEKDNLEADRKDFFVSIDKPLFRVCGSCGEISNSDQAVIKRFDPEADFFKPLRNEQGVVEVIEEGLVRDASDDHESVWLCSRCYQALRARKTPKFARCSGFRIATVPDELAVLNRMETRLIGLGISFTTCVNLYRDGQEFTRGNAINYWNDPEAVVRELPRPLKECGVVFLTSKTEQTAKYFRVRPDMIRRALKWLIANNVLYEDIVISEENLRALEEVGVDKEVPTIEVSNEEVQELRGQRRQINERDGQDAVDADTCDERDDTVRQSDLSAVRHPDLLPACTHNVVARTLGGRCSGAANVHSQRGEPEGSLSGKNTPPDTPWSSSENPIVSCNSTLEQTYCQMNSSLDCSRSTSSGNAGQLFAQPPVENNAVSSDSNRHNVSYDPEDVLENLTESFELEGNRNSQKTELEKIMEAAGVGSTNSSCPIGELRCCSDPIDEYRTERLMQCCFPTLFPNGQGGLHPLSELENRTHEYGLSEYCAHLMKWHDRRFIIHGNFKFFCMNLIQRRQIDGLVRRVRGCESRDAAVTSAGVGLENCDQGKEDKVDEKKKLSAAMQVLDSLKPFFRVVRGSGLYWANVRDDLMSMIGNRALPTRWPTFFLTLSAADTIWPDFARACNPALTIDDCRRLSFTDRRRYLNENPDISARHFHRRFQSFFDTVLCGRAQPLGEIIDHFWRVEFQQRGSPHIHCLLWIKDAPDVVKLSETEEGRADLAAYVDKRISVLAKTLSDLEKCSCSTCNAHRANEVDILAMRPPQVGTDEWSCDLSRLVQRVQQHECFANSSCRKKSSQCRFGFPKPLEEHTRIETHVASDGTPSMKVHLKREVSTINNFSPHILSCWRANMDLQLIGNSYGAAEYAGAYVSKAEPDTLRFRRVIAKAVQRCDPHLPYHSILKKVANATLSVREVGAPEAIYTLLRSLPMHSKSRSVVKVKAFRHNQRYYRVEPRGFADLAALAEQTSASDIRIEQVEKDYMNRPAIDLFETMSLATFIEDFEHVDSIETKKKIPLESWKCLDDQGWIRRRSKSVVVQKSPWVRPNSADPNFCFSEIFLYIPWRSLQDLPETDEECIEHFFNEQESHLDSELKEESNAKLLRQKKLDLLKESAIGACSVTALPASEYVFISSLGEPAEQANISANELHERRSNQQEWTSRHEYSQETVHKASDFVKKCLKPWINEKNESRRRGSIFRQNERSFSNYRYPIGDSDEISDTVETMAESQWIPFAIAMDQARRRFKCGLEESYCKPLQMIINGEGGSGKSWLIKHIVKDMHNVFGEHAFTRRTSKRVLLLAHQGTAAFNIKGMTICSALSFAAFTRSAFSVKYTSLAASKTGPSKLKQLQQRFKDVHLVIIDEFSMISCGMLYWIDQRMREIWPSHSDELFGGRDVYFTGDAAQLEPIVPHALSTPMSKIKNEVQRRGKEIWASIEHVCMLTSQNRGKLDPEWFAALRRLREKAPTPADIKLFNSRCLSPNQQPDWVPEAKHIAHKNVDVNAANEDRIKTAKEPIVHITSQHFVQQKRLTMKRDIPAGTVRALVSDAKTANSDRDRVVASRLNLCIGAPVTLTYNMAQNAGLCNGTNAVVYDFMFVAGRELPIVLVQIIDAYIGPSLLDDVPNIVPIAPKDVSWGKPSSDLRVVRRGIPLRLAYAMTVHKVQGLTCSYVVFQSSSIPNIAFAYVALSRIKHRNSIVITHRLTLDKLAASPDKIASFAHENDYVLSVVSRTTDAAAAVVRAMKEVALIHNKDLAPR